MDKIELVTQPERAEAMGHSDSLQKLKEMVEKKELTDEQDDKEEQEEQDERDDQKDTANLASHKTESEPTKIYDDDGFEIPRGKIPIDGHFSTNEIKELVELAQEKGLIDKEIEVEVVEHNAIGDKVLIEEKTPEQDPAEKDKDEKDEKLQGKQ